MSIFDVKMYENMGGHQMSRCLDTHSIFEKRDKAYLVFAKVILDSLRFSERLKFHFRMLFSYEINCLNIYLKKTTKTAKIERERSGKSEKIVDVQTSGHPVSMVIL